MLHRAIAASVCVALVTPAFADEASPDHIPNHEIDRRVNGGITGIAMGLGLVSQLIPIRRTELWGAEITSLDEGLRGTYSARAGAISDALFGASIAAPALYLLGTSIDDADGDKLILYGQSLVVNTLLVGVMKRLVQRPRPYLYSKDPAVRRYAKEQGEDAFLSFYSGHAALTFGAAVTGAYLLGASGASESARALAWGGGMMLASATANLRVRAGKHFYSDVVIGGIIGMGVGYLVPALHADGDPYVPSSRDLAIGAAGILGGYLISSILPLESRTGELEPGKSPIVKSLQLQPMPVNGGFGFALGGGL